LQHSQHPEQLDIMPAIEPKSALAGDNDDNAVQIITAVESNRSKHSTIIMPSPQCA